MWDNVLALGDYIVILCSIFGIFHESEIISNQKLKNCFKEEGQAGEDQAVLPPITEPTKCQVHSDGVA